MEKIIIESLQDGFNVIKGERFTGILTYEETIGLITSLIMPEKRPCQQWLRSNEENDRINKAFSIISKKLDLDFDELV